MKLIIVIQLTFIAFISSAQQLRVGDTAPPISAYKWLKGKPVNEFQKGKIYLIEFGATWCVPCAAAIPELSRISNEYKSDVQVISFFVMEQMSRGSGAYGDNVVKYVKKRSDQMKYSVALDHEDATMQTKWLNGGGQNGIPYSVIVDREGKVAWKGNSIKTLEQVLDTLTVKK